MKSLVLLEIQRQLLQGDDSTGATITAITLDPSTDSLYVITEVNRADATTEVSIFSAKGEEGFEAGEVWTVENIPNLDESAPSPNVVVSLKYLPESDSLVVVLSNGDIEQIFEPGSGQIERIRRENVGCVDQGIKAAAWSPDEELLVLVTGDDKLIEMTKDFEVLLEGPLRSTEFGEDAPVNVGWGDKSTQFRGSVGKSAESTTTTSATSSQSSPDDDALPRISWRGDSAFFSVSSLDPLPPKSQTEGHRRILRMFSRVAGLSSTSEPTRGLEHSLAWQPSGSIIAGTQKLFKGAKGEFESHHVVFFERNGLRRYDFALREGEGAKDSVVRELGWNSDSSILAVWIERRGTKPGHAVQLWYRNNYYWYLKQEILPRGTMTALFWHPEKALELHLTTTIAVDSFSLCWDTFSSTRAPPEDDGSVAVVDGSALLLTPFRIENIPPPMSSVALKSRHPSRVPVHVSFSSASLSFASLFSDGHIEIYEWDLPKIEIGKPRDEIKLPVLTQELSAFSQEQNLYARQCACLGAGLDMVVAVLASSERGSVLAIVRHDRTRTINLMDPVRRLTAGTNNFVLEGSDGTIFEGQHFYPPSPTRSAELRHLPTVPSAPTDEPIIPSDVLSSLPEFCSWIRFLPLSPNSNVIIGLSESGRLYAGSRLLANDATSFATTPDFFIYTVFSHEAKFVPLFALEPSYSGSEPLVSHVEPLKKPPTENGGDNTIKRAVERGSKIVTVVSSSTSLVLQMPRGNLETIFPRPLVLRIVRQDLESSNYRAAFLACRRHRIDLNILYDHRPQAFKAHLVEFVSQVKQVDYLNLFLSGLKNEDVTVTMYRPLIASSVSAPSTSNKVNEVCDMVRKELEKRDIFHYANTILTAHVRKQPPDYESALKVLVELKAKDSARAEDAVKYIIFLSDANKLFDLALGMYDFPLVLMIAQHSQKDPREYLPFLRELRQLDPFRQRFKIDDHLERFDSALRNLAKSGAESFEEALAYTKKYGLFTTALQAYKDDPAKSKTILSANADHLEEHKHYAEAGAVFSLSGQPHKAMAAYQKANAWQELFTIALSEGKRSASDIKELAIEVAESLSSKRRHVEAGRVLLDYSRDVEAAVGALVEGLAFAEAIRLTSLYNRRDLIETHVKPGTLEMQARMLEDVAEVIEQVEKQIERLDELREKRASNPSQYFCWDDLGSAMDNVELQPDGASDAGTAFTRYTAAPTTIASTRHSSRTAASRRKGALKRLAGKKGTVYEEMYLLNSLKKTVEVKLVEVHNEAAMLLPILLSLNSTPQRSAAVALQAEITALEKFLVDSVQVIYGWREEEWAKEAAEEIKEKERGEWVEKPKAEEGTEKVTRPVVPKGKWRVGLLDLT